MEVDGRWAISGNKNKQQSWNVFYDQQVHNLACSLFPIYEGRKLETRNWKLAAQRSRVSHQPVGFSGRSRGNKMTSRMERELVRSIARRSTPRPSPPVGGMP